MPAELYLLRHGQTQFNAERRLQGQCDSPLTALGQQQAFSMGQTLGQRRINPAEWQIFSSPLGRTRQTTAHVCQGLGITAEQVIYDSRLQEVGLGQWEHQQIDSILQQQPALQTRPDWYFAAPEGETFATVTARLNSWLADVAEADRQKLIVISHGLTGMVLRALLLALPYDAIWQLERPQDAFFYFSDGQLQRISALPTAVTDGP